MPRFHCAPGRVRLTGAPTDAPQPIAIRRAIGCVNRARSVCVSVQAGAGPSRACVPVSKGTARRMLHSLRQRGIRSVVCWDWLATGELVLGE